MPISSLRQPISMLSRRLLAPAAVLLCAGAVGASSASAIDCRSCVSTTQLISRSTSGGLPNGPSSHPSISQDDRIGRVAAFQSDASNLVSGDSNGLTDVFAVLRSGPWGTSGTPWRRGATRLLSRGLGGRPANGRSYGAAASGSVDAAPTCVAFVSEASNLVRGDTNGKADAFVADLATGSIRRVSVSASGRQSNGTTYDVAVDGDCDRVAFTSNATNLALTATSKGAWKSAVTTRPPSGTRQVYLRFTKGLGDARPLKGLTFLVSASTGRRAGNGHSSQPTISPRRGDSIAFASTATNLSSADRGSRSDIYWRSMRLALTRISGQLTRSLEMRTYLVSRTASGNPGNGASTNPASSGATLFTTRGIYVAYQTSATNLFRGDTNRTTDVVRAHIRSGRVTNQLASRNEGPAGDTGGPIGNGQSIDPSITDAGSSILFSSKADNIEEEPPSRDPLARENGVADAFLFTEKRNGAVLESLDSNEDGFGLATQHPSTSARTNYLLYETREPLADLDFAADHLLGCLELARVCRLRAAGDARYNQIYMRYMGPQ